MSTTALALGLLTALPAAAQASTFCVPSFHAACPANGTNVAKATVEAAMTSAADDGVPDTVHVAAGTFADTETFSPAGTDPLTVVGAGAADTILTSASAANVFVINLNSAARDVTLRDLAIRVPASFPDNQGAALQTVSGKSTLLERVRFDSHNPGSSGTAGIASTLGTVTLRQVTFGASAGGALSSAVQTNANTTALTLEDVTVRGAGSTALSLGGGTITGDRVRLLDCAQVPVALTRGTATLANVLATGPGTPFYVLATSASDAHLTVDHATAHRTASSGNVAPFNVQAGSTGDATLTVRNTIATGYQSAYVRTAGNAGGSATLSAAYVNMPESGGTGSGPGTATLTAITTADPAYVDAAAGDFRLAPGSPSIDAGDPAAGGPATDLAGAARIVDGNGDGVARRDLGVFEAPVPPAPPATPTADPPAGTVAPPAGDPDPAPAPTTPGPGAAATPADRQAPGTRITAGPGKRLSRRIATFRFRASEPGARFECSLDGRRFTRCATTRTYRGLRTGRHVLRVRAVDAAGNRDRTPAVRRFTVPRRRR